MRGLLAKDRKTGADSSAVRFLIFLSSANPFQINSLYCSPHSG